MLLHGKAKYHSTYTFSSYISARTHITLPSNILQSSSFVQQNKKMPSLTTTAARDSIIAFLLFSAVGASASASASSAQAPVVDRTQAYKTSSSAPTPTARERQAHHEEVVARAVAQGRR